MSFKSSLKLDSPIFDRDKRRAAGGRAVRKTATDFAKDLQDKMESSPHTGKIVIKARGETFRVRHQQSRRGERPASFTKTLLRSVRSRRVSDVEYETTVDAFYAERLQTELGRVIVSRQDEVDAQKALDSNLAEELQKLL